MKRCSTPMAEPSISEAERGAAPLPAPFREAIAAALIPGERVLWWGWPEGETVSVWKEVRPAVPIMLALGLIIAGGAIQNPDTGFLLGAILYCLLMIAAPALYVQLFLNRTLYAITQHRLFFVRRPFRPGARLAVDALRRRDITEPELTYDTEGRGIISFESRQWESRESRSLRGLRDPEKVLGFLRAMTP